MTLGLNKDKIIEILKKNDDVVSEELLESIAEAIIANNKAIEQQVTKKVLDEMKREMKLYNI